MFREQSALAYRNCSGLDTMDLDCSAAFLSLALSLLFLFLSVLQCSCRVTPNTTRTVQPEHCQNCSRERYIRKIGRVLKCLPIKSIHIDIKLLTQPFDLHIYYVLPFRQPRCSCSKEAKTKRSNNVTCEQQTNQGQNCANGHTTKTINETE